MWVFTITYGGYAVMRCRTPQQRRALLPRVGRGNVSLCFGLSEPRSGSDAAALTTRARRDGDGYVINRRKIFTSA
jgi:alkylation response protein AidB-like acyl-CoA dehydrogenase